MSVRLLTSSWASSLPNPLTPLVGRTREIAEVTALLSEPASRLVTLTGPGGAGKTRLAVRVAADVSDDFPDGVLFTALAPIRDAGLVLSTIAHAAGLAEPANGVLDEALALHFADRGILLVLDNFEQVVEAGPSVAKLLERCPGLKALVTSRAPVQVAGEQRYPVAPLSLPDKDAATLASLDSSEAAELFLRRARAIRPTLTLTERDAPIVADICWRLDGLPLALELAAARTNVLSLAALQARLSDRLHVLVGSRADVPERLRTMRQAIAWSCDLLSRDEQAIFRRAAVFAGGASMEALEAVANAPKLETFAFLDALGRLVDHSLMNRADAPDGSARFTQLETLREFGLDQLREQNEETVARDAHAAWLLAFTEDGATNLIGAGQREWLARLDLEQDNLRAALAWLLDAGDRESALRICSAVWRWWGIRGHVEEGRTWLDRALAAGEAVSPAARLAGLIAAAYLAEDHVDFDEADRWFERAVTLAEAIGDRARLAEAIGGMGTVAHDRGEFARATELHRRSAEIAEEIGDQRRRAVAIGNLGAVAYYKGDFDEADRCWTESSAITHALGDFWAEAQAIGNLGALANMRGDYERGEQLHQEALALQREFRNGRGIASALVNLGELREIKGDWAAALANYEEALEQFLDARDGRGAGMVEARIARVAFERGDQMASRQLFGSALRRLQNVGDLFGLLEAAEEYAGTLVHDPDGRLAATLFGAVAALRTRVDSPRRDAELPKYDAAAQTLRRSLGRVGFERAFAAGERMTPAELAAFAEAMPAPNVEAQPAPALATASKPSPRPRLSDRELDVLRLVAAGHSNREIADVLFISPRTASTHVEHILGKLEVNSRSAAVAVALREGLV